jgi:hypothetical protein
LTVPVFIAPTAESGHGGADLVAARLADDGSPSYSRRLSALRLLGVLINHGEQWFTASSRLVPMNGARPEDNGCGEHCRVRTGQAVMSSKRHRP